MEEGGEGRGERGRVAKVTKDPQVRTLQQVTPDRCHKRPLNRFTAYPRDGVLEGQRASGQNARGSTGRAVVTERVQYPVAAASARCEREGQAQAPQQQDPELRTGDGDIIAGGQEVHGAGSEGPCLGQQQCTGRRSEVRKMRLVHALIACTGSRTLPALERPRVVISVWCRGRGGTEANDCPVRWLVRKVT